MHWDVTERIRIVRRLDFTGDDRVEATYVEHAKILRAVLQRKPDQAQLLLRSHVEQSRPRRTEARASAKKPWRAARGCGGMASIAAARSGRAAG